jgi:hypothetical protein
MTNPPVETDYGDVIIHLEKLLSEKCKQFGLSKSSIMVLASDTMSKLMRMDFREALKLQSSDFDITTALHNGNYSLASCDANLNRKCPHCQLAFRWNATHTYSECKMINWELTHRGGIIYSWKCGELLCIHRTFRPILKCALGHLISNDIIMLCITFLGHKASMTITPSHQDLPTS